VSADRSEQSAHAASRLSRRSLLWLSGLAAAAIPAGSWPAASAAADPPDPDAAQAYRDGFLAALAEDKNIRVYAEPGREFCYRPGQLLVSRADTKRVTAWLREVAVPFEAGTGFGGVTRLLLDRDADIPSLVAELRDRDRWPGGVVPAVQPHHVIVGYDNIMGNPAMAPAAATAPAPPDPRRAGDGKGVMVGICDTGIWRDAGAFHPLWLLGAYAPEIDDEDSLYLYSDVLAPEGGHGTFVAGVLRQAAPGVRFDPEPALSGAGLGDEEMLVDAIGRLDRRTSIISLSLGCFTQDDVPPLPIVNRLAALPRDVVVVAAAGNSGGDRPAWPAALPDVIAVAAVGGTDTDVAVPAAYSNSGSWVDACAEGTRTSTYVTGRMELKGQKPAEFLGYAQWSGTSFATPHVAGRLAALMTTKGCTATQAAQSLLTGPVWKPGFGVFVG
jgi:subtilisin family serine protease